MTTKTRPRRTYTVREVAEMLGISLTKTYHDILAGEIPSIRLGKRIIVSRTSFDRWLGGGGKTAA